MRSVGFGSAAFTGRCEIVGWGTGSAEMTPGTKWRFPHESRWRIADSTPVEGTGTMRIRQDSGQTTVLEQVGGIRAHSRMGGTVSVTLQGSGKVAAQSRWRVIAGAGNECSPDEVSGPLPPAQGYQDGPNGRSTPALAPPGSRGESPGRAPQEAVEALVLRRAVLGEDVEGTGGGDRPGQDHHADVG